MLNAKSMNPVARPVPQIAFLAAIASLLERFTILGLLMSHNKNTGPGLESDSGGGGTTCKRIKTRGRA